MNNDLPILREPTRTEDLHAKYGEPLVEALKTLLTIGGGVVGAEAGPLGALAGAGLGSAGAKALENTYKSAIFGKNAVPSATYGLPEAALKGSTAEMGGQVLGKVASSTLKDILREQVPQKSLKDYLATDANNVLRSEYHGSSEPILNPVKGKTDSTKGSEVFFTSPQRDTANSFATLRAYQKLDPEEYMRGVLPQGHVTPYMMSKVNTMNITPPVSFAKASELGEIMGVPKEQIDKSIMNSMSQHGNIDGEKLWEDFLSYRNKHGELGNIADIGTDMIQKLKDAGYRRLLTNMDPGLANRETVHMFPEEDLYSVGGQKLKDLQNRIELSNKKTQPILSDELAKLLGKGISSKAIQAQEK